MSADVLVSALTEHDRLRTLGSRDWEQLIGQARQARLLSRLAHRLLIVGSRLELPEGPRKYLVGGLYLSERQRHEVTWEVQCIAQALQKFDFPVVLLKGAAYLIAGLPPAHGRLFADIDIMVPRVAVETAEGALFSAGWISDERDPYNQRYYREWMHEIPPLRHIQRNTFIDLHHTITPPTSRFHVDGGKLIARAIPIDGFPGLSVLSPEDMVLHSATHLFQEGEFGHGLRDLLDLHDLLRHFGERRGFWESLLDRADELGLQAPLFHALFHIHRLFGTQAPTNLLLRVDQLCPGRIRRRVVAWLFDVALRPMHPSCDTYSTPLVRWVLYVRSHALRMPLNRLVPHLVRKAWMRRRPTDPFTKK